MPSGKGGLSGVPSTAWRSGTSKAGSLRPGSASSGVGILAFLNPSIENRVACGHRLLRNPIRADLAPPGALRALALQRPAQPLLRRLVRAVPGLLPAALDDARLRRNVGLGTKRRGRLRVVHRHPRLRHRPRFLRPWWPRAPRALQLARPPSKQPSARDGEGHPHVVLGDDDEGIARYVATHD